MKILIFGATGTIGSHLVSQALAAGHGVTAFVRTPSKLTVSHPNLSIVQGDVLTDQDRVADAVAGQDAVFVALGAGLKGRVRSEGTRNIISAMQHAGVRRLICQTTIGAGESFGNLNLKWKFVFRVPLRRALADHELQEEYVLRSELAWTIVRPAAFTDGPKTSSYKHGFPSTEKNLALKISRADVAQFMLKQLEDDTYMLKSVSLSY